MRMGNRRRLGNKSRKSAMRTRRSFGIETLERRVVLAASDCLGAVIGTVGLDSSGNGMIEMGETINGATIELFRDANGDNMFNRGTDTPVGTDVTNANGQYEFSNLESGTFFVVQPSQTVGTTMLDERASGPLAVDGTGVAGETIDTFITSSGPTRDDFPPGSPVEQVFAAAEALGGQRDFIAEITAGDVGDSVEIFTSATGNLNINPSFDAIGFYAVVWDGVDSAGAGLSPTGLGGVDLTEIGGTTGRGAGIQLTDISLDQTGTVIRVTVFSNANDSSEATASPGAIMDQDIFFSFQDDFTTSTGTGADFTNVGAVVLEIQSTQIANDGQLSQIGVRGTEPINVNFVNEAPVPAIDIEKFTNGFQADNPADADVPIINLNETTGVVWRYVVTNTGQSNLNSVQVNDDRLGITLPASSIISRSINGDNILDVGEVWTYEVAGTATVGAYTNTGTVQAVSVENAAVVMDSDSSNYRGIRPAIDIEKATNGSQADLETDADVPNVPVGSNVTWTYAVTNTGTDNLTNIVVTDSDLGGISNVIDRGDGDNILAPAERWTYQATGRAIAGPYENQGTVIGTAIDNTQVTDSDLSHYVGLTPGINIEKSTNGVDADTPGTGPSVIVGNNVTFTYVVTNTGQLPLANVVVEDDNGTPDNATDNFFAAFTGGDTNANSLLDLTEAWNFTANRAVTLGAYRNLGTVRATDPAGTAVTANDPSNHVGVPQPAALSKRVWLASAFA